ncbi:hypothetical protein EVAR_30974_1 [Eumeta japonica]|uniref:Uncharacterized protein n=1 Tax=Eumeta variegata TaxID=151549 RepID=A0A4C1W8W3_EUMVA|nr:hypothetical protein EVAR_30974_1 [Eumeta japonica]
MCEVSLKDRCRNSEVREPYGLKKDVVTSVEKGMLRWPSNLERKNEIRLTKQIYIVNVCDGKVGKGRPRKSYVDEIGERNICTQTHNSRLEATVDAESMTKDVR